LAATTVALPRLSRRAGGFVAKYMGDGVLAYFGYPRADEQDAERAMRVGLALVEVVAALDTAAGAEPGIGKSRRVRP